MSWNDNLSQSQYLFCPWHDDYKSNLMAIVLVVLECEVPFPTWILIKSRIQVWLLNPYRFLATPITPIKS